MNDEKTDVNVAETGFVTASELASSDAPVQEHVDEGEDNAEVKVTEDSEMMGTVLEVNAPADADAEKKPSSKKSKKENTLDRKDYSWLKKTDYLRNKEKWSKTFVIQHKKYPGKIAEIKAASAVHACSFIHWKPNQVRLLEVRED